MSDADEEYDYDMEVQDEDEFEYNYASDDEQDNRVSLSISHSKTVTTRSDTKRKVIDLVAEEEETATMKCYELDVYTLPGSMQSLVAQSEPWVLRMTFFLEDLNGYVVRGPKRLKPLLEQTISRKLREHKDAIIDMEALDIFVQTCIVDFHDLYHYCPVCHKAHDSPAASLVPCSQDTCLTQFTEQGLGRDIAVEIRSDPEVVELMITMTYWACLNHNTGYAHSHMSHTGYSGYSGYNTVKATNPVDPLREAAFTPFPIKFISKNVRHYDVIRESLDKLPSVLVMKDMIDSHTFHNFFADDVYLQEAHYLLTWILNSHRAAIKFVPLAEQTEFERGLSGGNLHMFKIVNAPEKEAAFLRALGGGKDGANGTGFWGAGKADGTTTGTTEWVYHGSRSGCWHSIIRNSLKNLSNTKQMTAGAAYGAGIYLGTNVQTSMGYVRMAEATWQQNTLGIQWCILVAEKVVTASKSSIPSIMRVEPDEDKVINRYLLCGDAASLSQVKSVANKT